MTTAVAEPGFRRAIVLMTGTSFLVPAAGVITAPLLAHALSTNGRGELAAAVAPAGLMLAVATFGLPDALTYFLAKRPEITRRALLWASLVTVALGTLCVVAVRVALPFLRDGDRHLGQLLLLATILTIPALVVTVLRGAAMGRQMWGAVAADRLINTTGRLGGCLVLFVMHDLTVLTAVIVSVVTPMIAGVAYVPLLRERVASTRAGNVAGTLVDGQQQAITVDSAPDGESTAVIPTEPSRADDMESVGIRSIVTFCSRVWFGSVVSMLLDRAAPLLMAPLSDVTNLGLYSVANTISDMPLLVALAISDALFGVNAKTANVLQVTITSRITILVGFCGCAFLGVTLPFWIGPLFGDQFRAATVPTLMLMASALLCIPGIMAGAGLAAWGHPGLRSIGLAITLVTNLGFFVLLVPHLGVYGACWASIIGNVVLTGWMVIASKRTMGVAVADLLLVRRSDVLRAWREGQRVWTRVAGRVARR